ncbi:MAG TPA: DUF4105 domain-containing protein [Polyangia bacterium]|nr:DUF4105 domain-containing protein [Polyangia bacterium]
MFSGIAAAAQLSLVAAMVAPLPAAADAGYADQLIALARSRHLADTREWRVLLHYRHSLFGGWKSEVDGGEFFQAGPRGRRDPEAELEASLRAFLASEPRDDAHAQCRLPARWEWLRSALGIDAARVPHESCPAFDKWRTGISATTATLVYATAYLNSPATMYGHTFLRLSRSTGEGNQLLDYIVNYAGDVDTENGLVYAFKGVTGMFPGRFYVMPYYVKVQEYSNIESRDLWEYELSFTPEQVRRLVMHAWETRTAQFRYYFFTRNCSYLLLSLMEVADPRLHLTEHFHGTVIPGDTVRVVLAQPGLVRRISARPSLVTVMKRRKGSFTGAELEAARAWATAAPGAPAPPQPPGESKERQALILDAAYDYLRYKTRKESSPSELFKQRERRLLLARGRTGVPPQVVTAQPAIGAPETGHDSLRLTVGAGTSDQAGAFETISLRGALHDYLDDPHGYPEDARLQMGSLRLRFENQQRALRLDRLDAIDIVSASPFDLWVQSPSWKVWFGVDNARELGCEEPGSPIAGWRCLYVGVTTGGGVAARLAPHRSMLFLLLAETDLGVGPAFAGAHDFRLGAGGEAMLAGGAGPWRFEAGARAIYYFLGDRTPALRLRVGQAFALSRWLALRAGVETANAYAQIVGELAFYF